MRRAAIWAVAVWALAAGAAAAQAPVLIQEPTWGEVRAAEGDLIPVAQARSGCARDLSADGLCFADAVAELKARGAAEGLVLGVERPVRDRDVVAGPYGAGWRLYRVRSGAAPEIRRAELPTSDVRVPRGCFALPGEEVRYGVEARGPRALAREFQVVSCGGPPRQASGPYQPLGQAYGTGDSWPATETIHAKGDLRPLAAVRTDCPPAAVLRDGVCYDETIQTLAADPKGKDLDVIAAKRPVALDDRLGAGEVMQTVLKKRGKGFKADKRWFARSDVRIPGGCAPAGEMFFRVVSQGDRPMVEETQAATCGAPLAPEPVAVWEAYGALLPLVEIGGNANCAPEHRLTGDACFTPLVNWMKSKGLSRTEAVMIDRSYGSGTRLFNGGPVRFSTVLVTADANGVYKAERRSGYTPSIVWPNGCRDHTGGPSDSEGLLIVNERGGRMAQAYAWAACPVRF
ncbi:MAG TPA: hypothetical protein VD929_04895 [Caulobacteraceae bacterium]|nr:hypothetical protein [Caulobacteraceae bacterium]